MGWLILLLAGICEVGFTTMMKLSENFTRLWPTIGFAVCAMASFALLSFALKFIPLGTAYAVWTGLGAFGTALIGIWYFGEPSNPMRMVFLFGLIAMIVGLKIVSPH
jgi:quaternary ammonium compound-resistance protein SugE